MASFSILLPLFLGNNCLLLSQGQIETLKGKLRTKFYKTLKELVQEYILTWIDQRAHEISSKPGQYHDSELP